MNTIKYIHAIVFALISYAMITPSGVQAERFSPWTVEELVGKEAPSFIVKDLSGGDVSLSSFKGRPILLNFWATWCPYCREERSYLNSLYLRYKEKGLTIIAISTDRSPEKVKEFMKTTPMDFVLLHDNSRDAASQYGVYSLPTSFLIDRKGIVTHKVMGVRDWTEKNSISLIEKLIRQ